MAEGMIRHVHDVAYADYSDDQFDWLSWPLLAYAARNFERDANHFGSVLDL